MDEQRVIQMLAALGKQQSHAGPDWRQTLGVTDQCPSLPRFHAAIVREDFSASERRHIGGCGYCQRTIAQVRAEVWHPTVRQLFWHSLERLAGDDAVDVQYHLDHDGCRRCRRIARALNLDGLLSQLAQQVRQGAADALQRLEEVLGRFKPAIEIAPPAYWQGDPAGGMAAVSGFLPGDEPKVLSGTYSGTGKWSYTEETRADHKEPQRRLTLEDSAAAEGTMLRLSWLDEEGCAAWQRIVFFRKGYPHCVAEARLLGPPPSGELLPRDESSAPPFPEEVKLYRGSFRAACTDDPAAVPHWQNWAMGLLQVPDLNAELRTMLEEIAREPSASERESAGSSFAML